MPKHKSGLFLILKREGSGNLRLRCILCKHELWHTGAKSHIKSKHPTRLAEYEQSKRPGTIKDHFDPREDEEDEHPCEGTQGNLNEKIVEFLVTNKLPLSKADDKAFRDLIETATKYGATALSSELQRYKVPSRRTLIEDYIEGESGLLNKQVTRALQRLEPSCKLYGATLLFDGAKDANGKGLEVFMVQSGPNQTLVWNGIPHDESKNTAWMTTTIKSLINGCMDFRTMSLEDPAEVTEESPPTSSSSSAARVKRQKCIPVSHLKRLFSLMDYVYAMGGDNAKVPVKAALTLEKEIATIPFGCAGHAFSRSFQHICEIHEFAENVLGKANDIVDLFLSRSQVREFLRTECDNSLYRLIPTRFVSAVGVCERLQELKSDLIRVVDSGKFADYRQSATSDIRDQCARVKSILHDDRFWEWITFFLKVSTGYVVAVRCMDGAKAGSACLVYKLWSMLSATIEAAFVGESDHTIASKELYEKIGIVVCKDWTKFHFPVYAAAYILTPQFREEFNELERSDPPVADELLKDAVHCCTTFYRRFDENAELRQEVLEPGDPRIAIIRARVRRDLEAFLSGEGDFKPHLFDEEQMKRSPASWWRWVGLKTVTILRWAAMRITSLSPSTTPVERLRKVHRANRTKTRNLLGYARALGLNFICCERLMARLPNDGDLDWKHVQNKESFSELSELDRRFLNTIEAEAATTNQVLDEIDEEAIATVEALFPDVPCDAEEVDVDASSVVDHDSPEGPTEAVEPLHSQEAVSELPKSMRGRIVQKKLFHGFLSPLVHS